MTDPTPIARSDYEKLKKFEEGYKKLVEETGCSVGGCGCCGSPWVEVDGSNGPVIEDMQTHLLDDPKLYTIVDGPDPYEQVKALQIHKIVEVRGNPNLKRLGIGQVIAIPASLDEFPVGTLVAIDDSGRFVKAEGIHAVYHAVAEIAECPRMDVMFLNE